MAVSLRPPGPELVEDPASPHAPVEEGPPADRGFRPSAEQVVTFLVVSAAVVFTVAQLHPSLILADTTPAGGDTGAHVWGPDYLRRALLPQGRIIGWAPDWYAGFPLYNFYFPLPALLIVALDLVLPYGVAFKLVTISGIATLPVAAWAFGRLAGMRFPGPALLAVAAVPFLFERGFTIYGGNIASTLAGEFGCSISLSLALLFLGVVARGLDTGRHRALAAVILALTGLSHLLPTIFAVTGALVLLAMRPALRKLGHLAFVLTVGALLAAFWSFPFIMRMPYANDMGWEKLTDYTKQLLPQDHLWLLVLALVGAFCSVALRHRRVGVFLVAIAGISAAVFVLAPQGRLWNARALPYWFLSLYMLAAVAVAEAGTALVRGFSSDPERPPGARRPGVGSRVVVPVAGALATWLVVATPLQAVPSWLPGYETSDDSFVPGWAAWNYSGYERKPDYAEYRSVVDTMDELGRNRGCGRAHWEYEEEQNRFGTPMALMLLPYWTRGCIASMEGLYFESSATTPYHFLTAGEVSAKPSNPQRGLPYVDTRPDLEAGVRHMQLMGVRYYMAFSPEAVAQADAHEDLTLVATTGNWRMYEVAGWDLVTPLAFEPAVLAGVPKGGRQWLDVGVNWFNDPDAADVFLAASGPESWARVKVTRRDTDPEEVGKGVTVEQRPRRPVAPAVVSNVRSDNDSLSFDVDRPGSPVLVKVSYFPNWRARGAEGPWRVAPNLMVVVPTSRHVTLNYGWTPVEVTGWLLTLVGVAALVVLWRRIRRGSGEEAGGESGPLTGDEGTEPGQDQEPWDEFDQLEAPGLSPDDGRPAAPDPHPQPGR